jgi:hypothetical protein
MVKYNQKVNINNKKRMRELCSCQDIPNSHDPIYGMIFKSSFFLYIMFAIRELYSLHRYVWWVVFPWYRFFGNYFSLVF